MKVILLMSVFVVSGVVAGTMGVLPSSPNPATVTQDQDDEQDNVRAEARRLFMRGKLASNQKIVEGLSVKNYDLIVEGAVGVKMLVKGQHWFVLDTPEYKRYSKDMEMAATRLEEAARKRNIDGAALRYFDLTLNCIDCHRYIEDRKH